MTAGGRGRRAQLRRDRIRGLFDRTVNGWRDRDKPVLHLLRPGKTGGTAFGHVLATTAATRYRFVLHTHRDTLAGVPAGEQVCFIVRDPASRFVSGFNSRLRKGGAIHPKEWTPAESAVFARFPTPDALALALAATAAEERAAAAEAMAAVSHLRRHQVDWVGDLATLRARQSDVLFVGRQWALDDDFARFVEVVGLPPGTTLPDGDIAHRTPPGMATSLSDAGRAAVLDWYRDDVDFLAELDRLGPIVGFGRSR